MMKHNTKHRSRLKNETKYVKPSVEEISMEDRIIKAFEDGDSFIHPLGLITGDLHKRILRMVSRYNNDCMIETMDVPDQVWIYVCESWEELYKSHFPYGFPMVFNDNILVRSPESIKVLKKECETNSKLANQINDYEYATAIFGDVLKPYPNMNLYESTKKAFEDGAKSVMHPLGLLTRDDYNKILMTEKPIPTANIPYPTWIYKYDNWDDIYNLDPRLAVAAFKYCELSKSTGSVTALMKACKDNAELVEGLKKAHVYYSVLNQ